MLVGMDVCGDHAFQYSYIHTLHYRYFTGYQMRFEYRCDESIHSHNKTFKQNTRSNVEWAIQEQVQIEANFPVIGQLCVQEDESVYLYIWIRHVSMKSIQIITVWFFLWLIWNNILYDCYWIFWWIDMIQKYKSKKSQMNVRVLDFVNDKSYVVLT